MPGRVVQAHALEPLVKCAQTRSRLAMVGDAALCDQKGSQLYTHGGIFARYLQEVV